MQEVYCAKILSTRTHVCSCGLVLQRDWNAAINILLKENLGMGNPEVTLTELEPLRYLAQTW
jgi:transposase